MVGVTTASPSSIMTKSAELSEMVALLALESVMLAVSVLSELLSVLVTTVNIPSVSPAAMVKVLATAVKSVPLVAVPEPESYSTVTSDVVGLLNVTVKLAVPASVTVWLAMVILGSESSSLITKSAVVVLPEMVALVALDNVKVAVSFPS